MTVFLVPTNPRRLRLCLVPTLKPAPSFVNLE